MRVITLTLTLGATLALGACASNDSFLGLASEPQAPTAALPAKPKIDPACAALAGRIDELRRDGVVERVEAAAKGKGSSVSVKRASLSQIAELEKANADFQAKCSTVPRAAVAPVQPTQPAPAAAAPAKAAKTAAVATKTAAATQKKAAPTAAAAEAAAPAQPKE